MTKEGKNGSSIEFISIQLISEPKPYWPYHSCRLCRPGKHQKKRRKNRSTHSANVVFPLAVYSKEVRRLGVYEHVVNASLMLTTTCRGLMSDVGQATNIRVLRALSGCQGRDLSSQSIQIRRNRRTQRRREMVKNN